MYVYTADNIDYDTPEQAAAAVEAIGYGSVVQFILERNLPGCLPAYVHKSIALWTLDGGVWARRAIFSSSGGSLGVERPGSNAIEVARLHRNRYVVQVLAMAGTPSEFWNDCGRHASLKAAEREVAKSQRCLPNSTYRIHDARAAA